jgi:predicted RNase H-like nuclease (RuvC/YqgF family)
MAKGKTNDNATSASGETDPATLGAAAKTNDTGTQSGDGEDTPPQEQGGSGTGDSDVRAALDRATAAIAKVDAWEGDKAGLEKRITDANAALEAFKTELAEWKASLTARDKKELETKETIAAMQTELAALRQSLTEARESLQTLQASQSHNPASISQSTAGEIAETAISSPTSPQTPQEQEESGAPAPKSSETKAARRLRIV